MIAVIFTSYKNKLSEELEKEYQLYNEALEKIAKTIPDFIKQDSARNENGFGISISYWKDFESAAQFKKETIHLEAQQKGRTDFYRWYEVKIVEITKEYAFNKTE